MTLALDQEPLFHVKQCYADAVTGLRRDSRRR
jgi:hypothetical protein